VLTVGIGGRRRQHGQPCGHGIPRAAQFRRDLMQRRRLRSAGMTIDTGTCLFLYTWEPTGAVGRRLRKVLGGSEGVGGMGPLAQVFSLRAGIRYPSTANRAELDAQPRCFYFLGRLIANSWPDFRKSGRSLPLGVNVKPAIGGRGQSRTTWLSLPIPELPDSLTSADFPPQPRARARASASAPSKEPSSNSSKRQVSADGR